MIWLKMAIVPGLRKPALEGENDEFGYKVHIWGLEDCRHWLVPLRGEPQDGRWPERAPLRKVP